MHAQVNGQALDLSAKGGGDKTGGHGSPHDVGVQAALLTSVPFAMSAAVAFWIAHNSQVCPRVVFGGLQMHHCDASWVPAHVWFTTPSLLLLTCLVMPTIHTPAEGG
jgi:hypothetical protein